MDLGVKMGLPLIVDSPINLFVSGKDNAANNFTRLLAASGIVIYPTNRSFTRTSKSISSAIGCPETAAHFS